MSTLCAQCSMYTCVRATVSPPPPWTRARVGGVLMCGGHLINVPSNCGSAIGVDWKTFWCQDILLWSRRVLNLPFHFKEQFPSLSFFFKWKPFQSLIGSLIMAAECQRRVTGIGNYCCRGGGAAGAYAFIPSLVKVLAEGHLDHGGDGVYEAERGSALTVTFKNLIPNTISICFQSKI